MEHIQAILSILPALWLVIKVYRNDVSHEDFTWHLFIAILIGIISTFTVIFQSEFFTVISFEKLINNNYLLSTYIRNSLIITLFEQVFLNLFSYMLLGPSFKNEHLTLKDAMLLSIYVFVGYGIGKSFLTYGYQGLNEMLINSLKIIPVYFGLGTINGYLAGITTSYISSYILEKSYIDLKIIDIKRPKINFIITFVPYFVISFIMEMLYYTCLFVHNWLAIIIYLIIEIIILYLFYRYFEKHRQNHYQTNFPFYIAIFINTYKNYNLLDR